MDISRLRESFLEESLERLSQLESALLAIGPEGLHEADALAELFRMAHSIKGSAGAFGFGDVVACVHSLEDHLSKARELGVGLSVQWVPEGLAAVDRLRARFEGGAPIPAAQGDGLTDAPPPEARDAARVRALKLVPGEELLRLGHDPLPLLREAAALGAGRLRVVLPELLPAPERFDPLHCFLSFELRFETPVEAAALGEVFEWIADDAEIHYESALGDGASKAAEECGDALRGKRHATPMRSSPAGALASAATPRKPWNPAGGVVGSGGNEGATIRVPIARLDALVDGFGEIVMHQSMVQEALATHPRDEREVEERVNGLEQATTRLQGAVMGLRMLPLSHALGRLPRMVHDLAAEREKEVRLDLEGESIEADRTLLEGLSEPLLHLVRNAIDHGIETPEEREALGKERAGRLQVSAARLERGIELVVADDGRGIPVAQVLERARAAGLVGADDEEVEPSRTWELVFHAGLSTAAKVDEVSGRGVGLDAVRAAIRGLGGDLSLHSQEGVGTRFKLQLPNSLASIDGQLVHAGGLVWILPMTIVGGVRLVGPDDFERGAEGWSFTDEAGQRWPAHALSHAISGELPSEAPQGVGILIHSAQRRAMIVAESLGAQRRVFVKSLAEHWRSEPALSGVTVLGDGRIGLILDAAGWVQHRGRKGEGVMVVDPEERASSEAKPAPYRAEDVRETLHIRIGNLRLAFPIEAVAEIRRREATTPIPDAPPALLGVINVNGTVLPLLDGRTRFGEPPVAERPTDVMVILERGDGRRLALLVDEVLGVQELPAGGCQAAAADAVAGLLDGALIGHLAGDQGTTVAVLDPAALVRGVRVDRVVERI